MKNKLFSVCLLAFFFGLSSVYAQSSDDAKEAKELEKITKAYVKAYDNFTSNKDKESVLEYIDPKLSSILIMTTIRDKVSYLRSDYDGFSKYLSQVINTPSMEINYKLADISKSFVSGNSGLVVYSVNYENMRDGEIWVKGQETVMLVYRKIKEAWKIIHYSVIAFEDEKFKGPCLCELFASTANFVAKTTIPQGKGYSTENLTFSFTLQDNRQVILLNQKPYIWESNGNVWETDEKGEPKVKLGVASERPEAVYTIVKYIFREPCASFKVKF